MYWNINDKERLICAFRLATDEHLIKSLLSDLLSHKELEKLATRLKVACLLYEGAPYEEIRKITGLSSKTIAKISKKLDDKRSGFGEIIKKFREKGHSYKD